MLDLWLADIAEPLPEDLLSADEKTEVMRYRREADRKLAAVSRAMRRIVLARYTGRPARGLRFVRGADGKPSLEDGGIEFNISHSGRLVAMAVSRQPVGVDIEEVSIKPAAVTDVTRYLSPEEQEAIGHAPDPRATFLMIWTAKEAAIKAIGRGLAHPLHSFTVRPERGHFVAVTRAPTMRDVTVCAFEVPGYLGAIAVRGTASRFETYWVTDGALTL